ncbi:RHS repeat domain-containing protein [Flavobacterium sp. ENC]|uniref:RHS repeat domain-containing protein n=1 Tax=Flavobacterium sp. ENC TaxID=2897330 RepID=UPI001E6190EC|nr:RHS repeat domain-containing protein [Flavobacterium sp. ENC]MCD0464985.1 RHS repeat protein [Flavobacterium sp. ENC]
MKKQLFFQLLFLLIFDFSIAQTRGLSNIVPPSPNASSLAQYADVPVSNYTGIPNISIPLIEVKSGKIELPVTLNYHASGIKVAEEASWVGLGWSLNAGGMITRQVRGLDDFEQYGYLKKQLPPSTANNLPDWSDPTKPLPNTANFYYYEEHYYDEIEIEHIDPEPDIFYYNFLQYSGKLVFEKQEGNIVKAVSLDQNNLIFSYDIIAKLWTVTDGNGWKYYLGSTALNAVETTTSHNLSSPDPITPNNDRISKYDPDIFDSAWYLTKVVTPEGDNLNFLYETLGKTISQISRYEQISDYLDSKDLLNGQYAYRFTNVNSRVKLYSASQQIINPVYLKKIVFFNGYVEFTTEDRTDLRTFISTDPKPKRLKNTKLLNIDGKLIKQFDFTYSYFNSTPSGSGTPIIDNEERKTRLKLESIQESTVNANNVILKKPSYTFSYNQTLLPEKTSYSLDYWGYNNGKSNSSIVDYKYENFTIQDRIKLTQPGSNTFTETLVPFYEGTAANNIFLTGANREVDATKLQASILQTIKYPTGGIVNFEYEPNDYFSESETLYEDEPIVLSAKILGNDIIKMNEKSFTLDKLTMVHLYFNTYNLSSTPITSNMTAALEDLNGNQLIAIAPWLNSSNSSSFYSYLTVFLPAGSYKLKVNNGSTSTVNIEANARYVKKNPTNKKIGAGLRIKSITTNDQGQFVKKKIYSYENNNVSTGRLISPYHFFYNNEILTNGFSGGYYSKLIFQQINKYLVRCSDSAIPFGNSAQGSVIGYNEVTVSDVDSTNINLGSSKYFYNNVKELPIELFIPGIPNLINLNNGQLLKEQYFNSNNAKVKETVTEYIRENTIKNIKGVKMFSAPGSTSTDIRFYDVFSEWWHPKATIETIFDINGQNPITTTTDYKYDNLLHKNLTETQTTNSKGQTIKTIKKYPSDLVAGIDETPAATISNMMINNVINPVIKSETIVDNLVVQSNIYNYTIKTHTDTNTSNNMYLPKNIKMLKKGTVADYEEVVQFVMYDNNGHIVQEQKTNGTSISYIWGYRNEYPIAKIENASYNSIPTTLITAAQTASDSGNESQLKIALNNLRNTTELSTAMVSTYTYIPVIGVSTITDPKGDTITYTYDTFGRLEFVKDKNGNILSENQYNYKP